jgi:hypothetical protein
MSFNLEFNLQELNELHTMLVLRKCELNAQLTHKNADVAAIAMRQLERVSPMAYYVECIVREHYAEEESKLSEEQIESLVEKRMNKLDKKLMQGHIHQSEYDHEVMILDKWAEQQYQHNKAESV